MFIINDNVMSTEVVSWVIKEAVQMTIVNDKIKKKDIDVVLNRVANDVVPRAYSQKHKRILELIKKNAEAILNGEVEVISEESKANDNKQSD